MPTNKYTTANMLKSLFQDNVSTSMVIWVHNRMSVCNSLPERLVISVELGSISNSVDGFLRFAFLISVEVHTSYVLS